VGSAAELLQDGIGGVREIATRVDERPVEIEDDERETGRGDG
jgi:hypothetical protein